MVDVVRDIQPAMPELPAEPEKLVELEADQLSIEYSLDEHPETSDPQLVISIRGDSIAALDEEALDGINAAIAYHGHRATLRATQPSHVVHVEPEYTTTRVKTFDSTRGDAAKPDGEDVTPAHQIKRLNTADLSIEIIDVPEVRTPYWGFGETVQVNRPMDCPDCTRGLVGDTAMVGLFLRCIQAVTKEDVKPCHAGCVVACGMPS